MILPKLQIIVGTDGLWDRCNGFQSRKMKFAIVLALLGTVAADVSHLSSKYLPPAKEASGYLPPVPAQQYGLPPVIAKPSPVYGAELSEPKVLEYIPPAPPAPTYLPAVVPAPAYIPPEVQQPQLAAPVSVTSEYLPPPIATIPVEPAPMYIPPAPVFENTGEGYTYRTVKRIKYRNRS